MVRRSRSGRIVLITWPDGSQVLRVRRDDLFARPRNLRGWEVFFVGRHPEVVWHSYRPVA